MKENLKKIIMQFHEASLPEVISRDIAVKLSKEFITVLYGLRRVGKTFCLYQFMKELLDKSMDRTRIVYINFEDERISGFNKKNFQEIFDAYYELYPENADKGLYLFLDEIQYVDEWDLFVKRIYETKKHRIAITGSSARLLSKEIATSLRGRTRDYEITPLSFYEYLRFMDISYDTKKIRYSGKFYTLKKSLEEYMAFGGYPVVAKTDNRLEKKTIIRNYLHLTIYRDLVDRYRIRSSSYLFDLIRYLMNNLSKFFSVTRYHKAARKESNISKDTVTEYIGYLQEIGFLALVEKYSRSIKERLVNPRKVFFVDNGICTLYLDAQNNIEKYLENTVYLSLKRYEEVYYYKTRSGKEVDFYIPGKKIFIQVCYDLSQKETFKRELEGIAEAMSEIRNSRGIIIAYEETEDIKYEYDNREYEIAAIPLWKWLLEEHIIRQ